MAFWEAEDGGCVFYMCMFNCMDDMGSALFFGGFLCLLQDADVMVVHYSLIGADRVVS